MDENVIIAIIVILIIMVSIITVISAIILSKKEERKKREWKESTKCIVCKEHSEGKMFCQNCLNRVTVIKNELPQSKTKNFEKLNNFKQELMNKIVYSQSKYEREYNSIRLMAVSQILKDKYFTPSSINETATFLEEFSELNYITNDDFINKYADLTSEFEDDPEEEEESNVKTENYFYHTSENEQNKNPQRDTITQTINVDNNSTPFKDGCLKTFGGGCGCVGFLIASLLIGIAIIALMFSR